VLKKNDSQPIEFELLVSPGLTVNLVFEMYLAIFFFFKFRMHGGLAHSVFEEAKDSGQVEINTMPCTNYL